MVTLLSKNLDVEQVQQIEGMLTGGIDAKDIAEVVQSEWGMMGNVPSGMVVQTIKAHQKSMQKEQQQVEQPAPEVPFAQFDPLAEIMTLAQQQKARVEMALAKEAEVKIPLDATGKAMKEYQETLALMQKMKIEHDLAQQKKSPTVNGQPQSLTSRIAEAINASERVINRMHG